MPIVHVHLRAGRTPAQKRALLDALHAAFVEAFRTRPDDRNQLIHEYAAEDFEARSGPEGIFVEAHVFPGRSLEAKRALYRLAVEKLEAAGVPRDKVFIALREQPLANHGIRGGQCAADVDLGYQLDV